MMRCDQCGKFKSDLRPKPHEGQWAAMNYDQAWLCGTCWPDTEGSAE